MHMKTKLGMAHSAHTFKTALGLARPTNSITSSVRRVGTVFPLFTAPTVRVLVFFIRTASFASALL